MITTNQSSVSRGTSTSLELMLLLQVERVSGEILDKSVTEEITQENQHKQGFLQMSGIQNGLFHSEEWRVLEINQNFMISQFQEGIIWQHKGIFFYNFSTILWNYEELGLPWGCCLLQKCSRLD